MILSNCQAHEILQHRLTVRAVVFIAAVLFIVTNLPWQLDDYDQAQQAFTSYEMINEGHWFYQRTPHELIAQKPPLIGWTSAGLFVLGRSWDVAWRLPSFIAATILATALFRAAKAAYGVIPGLISLSAFVLNLLTVRLATLVRTDMPLALITFLAGLLIFEKVRTAEEWRTREQWVLCGLLTVSMWIKGPFIFLFLLPAVALFQWRWRAEKVGSTWAGWWPWVLSFLLFLPWVIGGLLWLPTFYQQVIGFEVLGRLSTTVHRAQPVYFYFLHLLHKFAPWSIMMITLAVVAFRRTGGGVWTALQRISPATFWLVVWALSGLVIMSLVPSKRVDRVFSVIPPLCLLLAAQLSDALHDAKLRRRVQAWTLVCLMTGAIFATAYTSWKVGYGCYDHVNALEKFGRAVRAEAATHHWRYEVLSGSAGSEGMLLYLKKMSFIEPDDAVSAWNDRQIDALAVPAADLPELLPRLSGVVISSLRSTHRRSQPKVDYVLLVQQPVSAQTGSS